MINELLFFLQIVLMAFVLLLFAKKKYEILLHQFYIILIIFINLLSNYEIKFFGFHTTAIEPCGVGLYFLSIALYRFNEKNAQIIIKNTFIITGLLFFLLGNIYYFIPVQESFYKFIIKNYLYNMLVSVLDFLISYFIERKIYNYLSSVSNPIRGSFSVAISQLFDTIFYSFALFYNRPSYVIMSIITFSYAIKLVCIIFYTAFLYFQKENN